MAIALVFVLCVAFLFPGSLGHSRRPSWATLMWEVAPEDIGQISNLPYTQDHLLVSFAQPDITVAIMEVICRNGTALCLLGGTLLVAILVCSKGRRRWKEEISHPHPASAGTRSCHRNSYSICEELCRLEANVLLLQKIVMRMLLSYPEAGRTRGKKRKRRDVEEEERLFSVCVPNQSS
ncbi:hypothetical protein CIB84_013203 [Bambusicola thoracicus]|uniref:Uncharacterized protein n=1 Tax=Bambusicola thoracicus TaxID=9083 RepID=A0A2P4SCW5_BAMTH|nr:hypothetical protein CIB84_014312 [Bambusicola thoracicus]POI23049.1 hypothetical protein CIB84_013203 [Bambusicola thoracicus]